MAKTTATSHLVISQHKMGKSIRFFHFNNYMKFTSIHSSKACSIRFKHQVISLSFCAFFVLSDSFLSVGSSNVYSQCESSFLTATKKTIAQEFEWQTTASIDLVGIERHASVRQDWNEFLFNGIQLQKHFGRMANLAHAPKSNVHRNLISVYTNQCRLDSCILILCLKSHFWLQKINWLINVEFIG